jgi:hypothetical protein
MVEHAGLLLNSCENQLTPLTINETWLHVMDDGGTRAWNEEKGEGPLVLHYYFPANEVESVDPGSFTAIHYGHVTMNYIIRIES